jgi:hypothetical protein
MEAPRLFVVKKDGRREQYSRDKLIGGLRKACEKRPISENQMEAVAADLERELFARGENEVASTRETYGSAQETGSGCVHPVCQRLPIVSRHRKFPGRVGGAPRKMRFA